MNNTNEDSTITVGEHAIMRAELSGEYATNDPLCAHQHTYSYSEVGEAGAITLSGTRKCAACGEVMHPRRAYEASLQPAKDGPEPDAEAAKAKVVAFAEAQGKVVSDRYGIWFEWT